MRSKLLGALGLIVCISCASAVHSQPANPPNHSESPAACSETACPLTNPHPTHEADTKPIVTQKETKEPCPAGMIHIEGDYCPTAQENCLYAVDINGNRIPFAEPVMIKGKRVKWPDRCGEFQNPTKCLSSKKVHKTFCIDKYEYPNVEGELPKAWMNWYDVKNSCEAQGKRLCNKSEWTFACEGPDMHPYPYGDGYHRDKTACNFDNPTPIDPDTGRVIDVFNARKSTDHTATILNSLLVPSGSKPLCVSPFGVHDMVGNVDEFVVNETHIPYKSGLVGGHVFGVRNACRPMTEAHNEGFIWYETGGRCCKDTDPD